MPALKEIFAEMKDKVASPPAMQGITAVYQFVLTGEDGGNYYVKFTDGAGEIAEGTAENPSITITMEASDFKDMVAGKLNAMSAFMGGKLKLKGDMMLAMKLQGLLG
ncbi:MAG: SCP2 sterol-binding domain-containing protein [Desulfotomaculales bacterium]